MSERAINNEVLRLASGFARDHRRDRYLMTLQGYFDDSGSSGREPAYVLAGFLSTYDRWIEFDDKWRSALLEEGLAYFKMNEANMLNGEFSKGWTPQTRDAMVLRLSELVNEHAVLRVSVHVNRDEFDDLIVSSLQATIMKEFRDPYFLLFWTLARLVIEHQYRTNQVEPADFIFDQHGEIGMRALGWWPQWEQWINPQRKHLIGNPPIFRDDKKAMPIQAADMYASLCRSGLMSMENERVARKAVMRSLEPIPSLDYHVNKDRLLSIRAGLSVAHAAFFGRR